MYYLLFLCSLRLYFTTTNFFPKSLCLLFLFLSICDLFKDLHFSSNVCFCKLVTQIGLGSQGVLRNRITRCWFAFHGICWQWMKIQTKTSLMLKLQSTGFSLTLSATLWQQHTRWCSYNNRYQTDGSMSAAKFTVLQWELEGAHLFAEKSSPWIRHRILMSPCCCRL